ncbi:MAG TPA: hypothetical protein VFC29_21520, partial [Candidatus Limnocylindrales bacterium]|nr:hypothetical protein [Candidatus Limnocylindrales bacterium]
MVSSDAYDQRPRTMEEILCSGIGAVAPVVALERPGDKLPPLGAARLSPERADWKALVDMLIAAAHFVVLV